MKTNRVRTVMAVALILLFIGLSFNAYACLLPVNGIAAAKMENGCSPPDEQPVRQLCDAFKTLGLQSASEVSPAIDCQTVWSQGAASVSPLVILITHRSNLYDHPTQRPPQDLLLKISVFRI
ncbi:MAG: hypothetical protein GDA67_14190 [Nitrospira sp. CR1.3]|nr:hypothetical protein [Nitrospira sp. CR1.3]